MTTVVETVNGTLNVAVQINAPILGTTAGDLSITPAGTNAVITAGKILKTNTINTTTAGGNLTIATTTAGNILLNPGTTGQVNVQGGSTLTTDVLSTTTAATDLSVNPTGANVNFNNKNLINVAGITGFVNFLRGTVNTTNATATTILVIPIATNTNYTIYSETAVITPGTGGGAATAGATYQDTLRAYNTAGTVTLPGGDASGRITSVQNVDAALAAITLTYVISGTNVNVTATGIAATNIKWSTTIWYTLSNTT